MICGSARGWDIYCSLVLCIVVLGRSAVVCACRVIIGCCGLPSIASFDNLCGVHSKLYHPWDVIREDVSPTGCYQGGSITYGMLSGGTCVGVITILKALHIYSSAANMKMIEPTELPTCRMLVKVVVVCLDYVCHWNGI